MSTVNYVQYTITPLGIALVDETPEVEAGGQVASHQQLAEGLAFAYDAPDKTDTDQEQVSYTEPTHCNTNVRGILCMTL